ncbi:LLM class flavin-dependent oxidoreductase [Leifsonia sp. NPDC077715]|uniref:LLM class flavin-dependent oxidoreductase n=1 Tax=Leifsonia sp. NPDC077715 TaxID=3155539 RepID=UPI00342E2DE0
MTGFILGIELDGDGAHPAAWRAATHAPSALLTGRLHAERAQAAERAGFVFATFADAAVPPAEPGGIRARLDAIQRAAFAAPLTGSIGLVAEAGTVYTEPFHVATQLASLDYAARGRAGWVVGADDDAGTASLYGRVGQPARPADAVEVARRLWDSWETDAVIRDVPTGRYLDRDRVHHIRFEGDDYSVVGPSIVPRPPQGALPVFGPAALAGDAELDVAFFDVAGDDLVARAADEASRLRGLGLLAVVDLEVALDAAGVPAADRVAALDAHTPWAGSHARYAGAGEPFAALLAELAAVTDGVRLHPAVLDVDLPELAFAVLPLLRETTALAASRPGGTLRDALGLPAAVNRYQESA